MQNQRALVVVRLSRVTDATTSPERQLAACRDLCEQRGYEVVGVAEDLDVSAGKTGPFDRPELGSWLRQPDRFDVVVFFRVDRIVRRLFDLSDLIRWARKHGVTLVSATESHFDLSTDFGDIIAMLVAKVAEMELDAISERNASAAKHNIRSGKYRGGMPPWGYLPGKDEDGDWRLVPDPEQVAVIEEVAARVLDGETLRSIAQDLNDREVDTPRDLFGQRRGRERQGYEWQSGGLKRALTSPTLLGRVVVRDPLLDAQGAVRRDEKGRKLFGPETVVVGDDGTPLVRAEPVLDRATFERVGTELAKREVSKEPTARSTSLLLNVLHCGVCGRPAYRLKGGPGRRPRYRCASAQYRETCGNASISMADADEAVESALLTKLGSSGRTTRVWHRGTNLSGERREVDELLADLTDQLGTGAFKSGTPQRRRLDERIAGLAARQAELAARPDEPAGWAYEPTGDTVGEWWEQSGARERNALLRELGVTVTWRSHRDGGRTVVDELATIGI